GDEEGGHWMDSNGRDDDVVEEVGVVGGWRVEVDGGRTGLGGERYTGFRGEEDDEISEELDCGGGEDNVEDDELGEDEKEIVKKLVSYRSGSDRGSGGDVGGNLNRVRSYRNVKY
ncbi:hypothetical protein HDU99_003312, partial [Rhizoclosmatium hyalinum]